MLIDTHCHLDFSEIEEKFDSVMEDAKNAGVGKMLTVCTRFCDIQKILRIANRSEDIWMSIGLHPLNVMNDQRLQAKQIASLCSHRKIIAIGETGLDNHYASGSAHVQEESFIEHIIAAQSTGLPIIVHTRDAGKRTIEIMRAAMLEKPFSGVIHCFTESMEFAKQALELGLFISFSGIVTFKNAVEIQSVAKYIPLDRMLVETDAPYLAPVPYRGKTCYPAYVARTAEFIAALRGCDYKEICDASTSNFYSLMKKASESLEV